MNSEQYEELCRYFVAKQIGLSPDEVRAGKIPNARRPGLREYQHQIDLYWESGDEMALYLNIANAKWRGSARVRQPDVMLLQHVRQKVAAHKAFMITNVGFTAGAIASAEDEGIALHVVAPNFNVAELPKRDRAAIQASLEAIAGEGAVSVYTHRVERRGLGFADDRPQPQLGPVDQTGGRPVPYETRVITQPARATSPPASNRSLGAGETRGGPSWSRGDDRGGGFVKK